MKNTFLRSDEEDPQLAGDLTQGASQQVAPLPMAPPPPPTAPLPAPPIAAQQKMPMAPQAQAPKLPGMPPSVSVDEITPYLTAQRSKLARFGPDEQLGLQNSLNQRQNSFGNRATEGLKGFADALMMGVARAGNPNWQGQYQQQEAQYAQDQKNTLKDARASNLQEVESGMNLDKMDPKSPLSKTAQESYAPLFEKLGYPPGKLNGMSAANIDSTLQLMAAYGGKEIEAQIKQYEIQIERARLAAAAGKNESDQKIAEENQRLQAAKDLASKGKDNFTVGGVAIPFTRVSSDASKLGTKYLEEKIDLTPDVTAYAEKHGITPQEALRIKKSRGGE